MIKTKKVFSFFFLLMMILAFMLFALPGCTSFGFYTQAIQGQYKILISRQPIDKIIADPETPDDLKEKLNLAMDIRLFAIETLKLPGQDSYQTYVDVKQPYVVWAVFAAPQYSIEPKTWCYPIVGCAAYRGYFLKQDADTFAGQLKNQGYDVYVSGVEAYSTLGWFDDPILSTFIDNGKTRLAALIFHELAHHIFYVKDDTTFNESFAQAVEQEGIRRWFVVENDLTAHTKYLDARNRQHQFVQLIMKYRSKLEMMYAGTIPVSDKKQLKEQLFRQLRAEYQSLKTSWNGFSGYDKWFNTDLNNAKLITVAAYNDLVPSFQNILTDEGGNLQHFYNRCKDLAKMPKEEREVLLNQYSNDK
jgi:predicted aminopeptidase